MRWVIVGGSEIRNYGLMRSCLRDDDYLVYCDCGLKHQEGLRVKPSLIIGDFDSHEKPEDLRNVIVLPVVKDDTDTIFAVKEGIRRGYDDFLLLGVTGGRQDHNLGNIYALLYLAKRNKTATIIDDYSEIRIITAGETVKVKAGWRFFSLLNIAGTARGITIGGAKYNLDGAEILPEYQYGISNEVLGDEAIVSLREGNLLLVLVRNIANCDTIHG
ncbi:MAG: thiamine diphosphokinase [Synergistaceae bacterium]|nr:thiamine diphosphokinase [Synergistaceae bacterium]